MPTVLFPTELAARCTRDGRGFAVLFFWEVSFPNAVTAVARFILLATGGELLTATTASGDRGGRHETGGFSPSLSHQVRSTSMISSAGGWLIPSKSFWLAL